MVRREDKVCIIEQLQVGSIDTVPAVISIDTNFSFIIKKRRRRGGAGP